MNRPGHLARGIAALCLASLCAAGIAEANPDRTARTITRVEAQVIPLVQGDDRRPSRTRIDTLMRSLNQLERDNEAYRASKVVRRNRQRIDQLQDLLIRFDGNARRGGSARDTRSGPRQIARRLDRLARQLSATRGIHSSQRRQRTLQQMDAVLDRIATRARDHRGPLARRNAGTIATLQRRIDRASRRAPSPSFRSGRQDTSIARPRWQRHAGSRWNRDR